MNPTSRAFGDILHTLQNAARGAHRPAPALLAVSKTRSAGDIAALAEAGQRAFGENYVQEAAPKIAALAGRGLQWHLIGHLQSNKAEAAARLFDWVQSVDRRTLVDALSRHRPGALPPLDVLLQVNIDDEAGKHGCAPAGIDALADAVAAAPRLRLRGLMAIPAAHLDPEASRPAFARMRALFEALRLRHPGIDTLSMGMSHDAVIAVQEGATMVRIGTALFGPRARKETTAG